MAKCISCGKEKKSLVDSFSISVYERAFVFKKKRMCINCASQKIQSEIDSFFDKGFIKKGNPNGLRVNWESFCRNSCVENKEFTKALLRLGILSFKKGWQVVFLPARQTYGPMWKGKALLFLSKKDAIEFVSLKFEGAKRKCKLQRVTESFRL